MFGRSSSGNNGSNGKGGAEPQDAAPEVARTGEGAQHLSQAFDLLFGAALREHTQNFEQLKAETTDRLDSLERACLRHAETLEELNDKSSAALEREQADYRRRKAIESDLRQKFGQIRVSIDKTMEDTAQAIARMREEIDGLRQTQTGDQLERQQQLIQEVLEELAVLKASTVDRALLATRLERLAREMVADPS